jgi:hypothetical protein
MTPDSIAHGTVNPPRGTREDSGVQRTAGSRWPPAPSVRLVTSWARHQQRAAGYDSLQR